MIQARTVSMSASHELIEHNWENTLHSRSDCASEKVPQGSPDNSNTSPSAWLEFPVILTNIDTTDGMRILAIHQL